MSFTRATYRLEKGLYTVRDENNKIISTQKKDTIPANDSNISPNPDGAYDGVYDTVNKKFIPDYDYDAATGWFWPGKELDWSSYLDNNKGGGK
jgi:hypothetical protein